MKWLQRFLFKWDIFMFAKNIWRFRRELWRFRAYDYDYNLSLFVRSLEITRDFLESDKAMAVCSREHADQISDFIDSIDQFKNSIERAEKELGYEFIPLSDNYSKEQNQRDKALIQKVDEIENKGWNDAMDNLKKNMRSWWD